MIPFYLVSLLSTTLSIIMSEKMSGTVSQYWKSKEEVRHHTGMLVVAQCPFHERTLELH